MVYYDSNNIASNLPFPYLCPTVYNRDLPLPIQVELLEKALCAAKVELDDVKAEVLYREDQVEQLLKNHETETIERLDSGRERPSF